MKKIYIMALLFYLCVSPSYALDWKSLHERADKIKNDDIAGLQKESEKSAESAYVLGLVYLNQHKDKEAGLIFNKILQGNPALIEARWGSAEVLRRKHKLSESQAILEQLIKDNPDFSPAFISFAYIKYIQMKFDESVFLAYKVIRQGQKNVDLTNFVRAYLLYAGGKGMIAHYGGPLSKIINGGPVFSNLKKAQSLLPEYSGVYFGLGSFYLLAPSVVGGNVSLAGQYLEKAIEADPLFADAYVRLSQVYDFRGDAIKAKMYLDKALIIDPENELALDIKNKSCRFICVWTRK